MENIKTHNAWTATEKITFRFFFVFFSLFIIIDNNGAFPFWEIFFKYPLDLLHVFIPWVGKSILHLQNDVTIFTNGSGDTTYDYVIVFTIFSLSTIATIIWSAVDRKRDNYLVLYYWLTAAIRYYVALMLFSYGLIKVIKLQFPSPALYRLVEPYGDSSPMGLAWTFLGFSSGYNFFMGIAEVAALLLLFRRTMVLGCIIVLMATSNVMAVNYFYDVPVKILSTALFVMTFFLLSHDLKRLLQFLLTDGPVNLPVIAKPQFARPWIAKAGLAFKFILIGTTLVMGFIQAADGVREYGEGAPKPGLYGLYYVNTFVLGKDTLPPLTTDTVRWRLLRIEWPGFASVRMMSDSARGFKMTLDSTAHRIELQASSGPRIYKFHYTSPTADQLYLQGSANNDSIFISFKKKLPKDFRLMNRGFHWVNERPFNR